MLGRVHRQLFAEALESGELSKAVEVFSIWDRDAPFGKMLLPPDHSRRWHWMVAIGGRLLRYRHVKFFPVFDHHQYVSAPNKKAGKTGGGLVSVAMLRESVFQHDAVWIERGLVEVAFALRARLSPHPSKHNVPRIPLCCY
ncbi:hypothetical protein LCGC14_2210090 [marine sediment metagenome]|uniref:Uncharacterized protein n=1 Tax=marine sediment metagenome TaxID=412755 RepID=A0A0F9G9S1_9ZZZZ